MEEKKKEEGTCGGKSACGLHCGCCCCKTIKALALVLIGGVIGFGVGRCGSHRMMCPISGATTAVQVESAPMPTAAPKKAK